MENQLLAKVQRYKLVSSIIGLVLGLICILGGMALFFLGISGSASWTTKILGLESTLMDAAPGAVLFIVGLFVVYITKYAPVIEIETDTQKNKASGKDGKHRFIQQKMSA